MKLNINRLSFYLLFFATFVNIRYIEDYNLFKDACLLLVALYIFPRYPLIKERVYRKTNLSLLLFIVIMAITMIINFSTAKQHLNEMIIFSVAAVEFFLCIEIAVEKNFLPSALKCIRNALFIVLCINDFLLFTVDMEINSQSVYFIGDKFYVLYAHLILLALSMTDYLKGTHPKRWNYILLTVGSLITVVVGAQIESGSALVCVILFILFYIIYGFNWKWLFSNKILIGLLVFSTMFVFVYDVVLSLPFISYFITEVLHKTLLLSNRIIIYNLIPLVLRDHLLSGYGFGTSYEVWTETLGYGNAQNGILDWVCQCGILVLIPLYLLIVNSLLSRSSCSRRIERPLLAVLSMLAVYACVEITINIQFLACLAMVFGIIVRERRETIIKKAINPRSVHE